MPRNEPVSCRDCGHTTKIDRVEIGTFQISCTHKGCPCTACKFRMDSAGKNKVIQKYNASKKTTNG